MAARAAEFDYVVIGGGSAGCALAARLSEDPAVSVCLLEAGGSGRSVLIDTPILLAVTVPRKIHNWGLRDRAPGGFPRQARLPAARQDPGRLFAINAMIYMRGRRADYDGWAALGNRLDWSTRCCLYFAQ